MAFISQTTIQELNNRMDAVAVVSDYVRLEKRGGRFWACCPFHQEKTGSFTVNPELKSYYCFGCHKGGSVINFVMEMDKIGFPEAVENLAKKFGVELVYENGGGNRSGADDAKKKEREDLFELYQRISGTFHHFLLKTREAGAAKQYILDRGINIEIIERFRLGYVPGERQWLYRFLGEKGYSPEFLSLSGLFSKKRPDASLFAGRLIFPIADRQGRTVAFGGRYLPGGAPARDGWEPPKYINSPEMGIYKKGETLYAIDLALPEIRRTKTAYIAEGYMDVIALHQAGITNAVAPLGTAFTGEQVRLLKRWAENVILFFDTDGAGRNAAVKAIYTCRENGLPCALIAPMGGEPANINPAEESPAEQKDPADILLKHGIEALQKKAKCFINDFDYLVAQAKSAGGISGPGGASAQGVPVEGKAKAVSFLFGYIDLLDSEIARNSCIEAASDAFGLLPSLVREDYRRHVSGGNSPERGTDFKASKEEQSPGRTISPIRVNDELVMLVAVAVNFIYPQKERIFPKFRAALEIEKIEDPNAKDIYIALEECLRYGETGMDEFLGRVSSPELRKFLVEKSSTGEFSVNPERLIADGIKQCKVKQLKNQQREIIIKLRETKSIGSADERNSEVRELLAEKMRIDNEIHIMEQGRKA